jgi:hypothetical protein
MLLRAAIGKWQYINQQDFERFGDSLTNSQILSVDGKAIK